MYESLLDGTFSFVACPTRLGSITRTGPVTGKKWGITPSGVWIDADDAAELVEIVEDIWCFRTNGYIPTHAVFYASPTVDDLARKPND